VFAVARGRVVQSRIVPVIVSIKPVYMMDIPASAEAEAPSTALVVGMGLG
jgi:hypothetical protein